MKNPNLLGQFVDNFKSYTSKELKYFPLNTVTVPPPKPGVTLRDMDLGSEGSESDSGSSSSGSSYDSDSESDEENAGDEKKVDGDAAKVGQAVTDATVGDHIVFFACFQYILLHD